MQNLVKSSGEQISNLSEPRLVQRISFKNGEINFDYMGNSDFEWGVIPKVLYRILETKQIGKLVKKPFVLDFSPNVLIDKGTEIEVVCNADDYEEIKTQIEFLLLEQYNLSEPMCLDYIHSDDNTNFLCLDNNYFFSLDGNGDNFITFLDKVEQQKKQSNNSQARDIQQSPEQQVFLEQREDTKIMANKIDKLDLESIGYKTIEDIKQLYTSGIPFDGKGDANQHFPGYIPYHLNINFHNNLHKLGFECKELNAYVDPKTYKRAQNEILIWEPERNGASVWVGPLNYTGIKEEVFDMEKLTGIKMISNGNAQSPETILNNHYLQKIIDWKFGENKVSSSFIGNICHIISFDENFILTEEKFNNVKMFLRNHNLEEIIVQYLLQNFPLGKRSIEAYQKTAKDAMNILDIKIRFFDIVLNKLPQNLSFDDRMKKAERIWYKNRKILEGIKNIQDLEIEVKGLFVKKQNPVEVVEENQGKVGKLIKY